MHFEILVEDISGKNMLDILVPKIINNKHTFKVTPYKGIGRIPKNLRTTADPSKRILLAQLPKLLQGYGKTFTGYGKSYEVAVIVICDLDDKCPTSFLQDLTSCLASCNPKPKTKFCLAIEEGEAWFLGDIAAIKMAFPSARDNVLNNYVNDSICGTWEVLADAVFNGGAQALRTQGWQITGAEKSKWAKEISPHMDVDNNQSPSFNCFKEKILNLC